MCNWSDCDKNGIYSLSGAFGIGGTRTRTTFCSIEHLAYWCIKRLALPYRGVTQADERNVQVAVDCFVERLRQKRTGQKS